MYILVEPRVYASWLGSNVHHEGYMVSNARKAKGRTMVANRALLDGDVLFTWDISLVRGSPLYKSELEKPRAEQ